MLKIPSLDRLQGTTINFLHKDEKCLMFFRRHGMCLLFTTGKSWFPVFGIFLISLPILSWFSGSTFVDPQLIFFIDLSRVIMSIVLLHWLFLDVLAYFLGFMMVTDRRIIEFHKSVFLREEMNEIPFEHITNIHHEKNGLLQNILRYGMLRIDSNIHRPICMHFIPFSEEKFAHISRIIGSFKKDEGSSSSAEKVLQRRNHPPFLRKIMQSEPESPQSTTEMNYVW